MNTAAPSFILLSEGNSLTERSSEVMTSGLLCLSACREYTCLYIINTYLCYTYVCLYIHRQIYCIQAHFCAGACVVMYLLSIVLNCNFELKSETYACLFESKNVYYLFLFTPSIQAQ